MINYCGVYWISPKDKLPEDTIMCVFHCKHTRADNIHFGGYGGQFGFWDCERRKWYAKEKIDYWMSIPVLPGKDRK